MTPLARSRLTILTGAAAALLFFMHFLGLLGGLERWVARRLAGTMASLSTAGVSVRQALGAPFQIAGVIGENRALREERDRLLTEVAALKALEAENRELRALAGFREKSSRATVAARVTAKAPEEGTHALIIDRGTDDGVAVGAPVVSSEGVLIGKVMQADRATAAVLLLTDNRSRIGALVQNKTETRGVVQGKRGLSSEMRLIPQNEEVVPGDLIVTSGIEPQIPRGLVIGRVESVETQERNPFKTAAVSSPVAPESLEVVAVLKP